MWMEAIPQARAFGQARSLPSLTLLVEKLPISGCKLGVDLVGPRLSAVHSVARSRNRETSAIVNAYRLDFLSLRREVWPKFRRSGLDRPDGDATVKYGSPVNKVTEECHVIFG